MTELTERLTTLEKTAGDEVHNTRIYHVCKSMLNLAPAFLLLNPDGCHISHVADNQGPEGIAGTGERLAQELEDIGSRRSTLRRHYTPGDYMKYGSETEGYNSLGRTRRTMSASALGRGKAHTSQCAVPNLIVNRASPTLL